MLAAWLETGGTLVVTLPKRVRCAACDGGGCGLCGNRGAFRMADGAEPLRIALGGGVARPTRLRVTVPESEDRELELLLLDLGPAEVPSPFVRFEDLRLAPVPAIVRRAPSSASTWLALVVLTVVAGIVVWWARR